MASIITCHHKNSSKNTHFYISFLALIVSILNNEALLSNADSRKYSSTLECILYKSVLFTPSIAHDCFFWKIIV